MNSVKDFATDDKNKMEKKGRINYETDGTNGGVTIIKTMHFRPKRGEILSIIFIGRYVFMKL